MIGLTERLPSGGRTLRAYSLFALFVRPHRLVMKLLFHEIRRNPFSAARVRCPSHWQLRNSITKRTRCTSSFDPRDSRQLLSHATESVAAKTGDSVGGLLNATLGNLTELVIAIVALQAGQYTLVKASVARAIVTNVLFMLGASFGTKKSYPFERGHRTGQRSTNRALRCSGSCAAQFTISPAESIEFLARRNDIVRNAHRIPGDQRWALRFSRRFSCYGLP